MSVCFVTNKIVTEINIIVYEKVEILIIRQRKGSYLQKSFVLFRAVYIFFLVYKMEF